jgi:ABC-type Fe3+ transport system permease subunit
MKKWRAYFDYLFFKGYQVGLFSGNYRGLPYLVPITYLAQILTFHFFSIFFIFVGLFDTNDNFKHVKKLQLSLVLIPVFLIIILLYFYPKNRARLIIDDYEDWERKRGRGIKPVIVFTIYFFVSSVILFFSALFKNKDWIFSN